MRKETALRYAAEITARVRRVNGLLATPLCDKEAVRIRRVWVFGSTVKGSAAPNDLDVLLDLAPVGRYRNWKQGKLDRRRARAFGVRLALCSRDEAYKWLTKGMRKVSRHDYEAERGLHLYPLVLIYPRNDLPAYMAEHFGE